MYIYKVKWEGWEGFLCIFLVLHVHTFCIRCATSLSCAFFSNRMCIYYDLDVLEGDSPSSRVSWPGWKSMLIGDDPWFKVLATVFGKSSGTLNAWLWPWPGNDTGSTLTGRLTCKKQNTYHKKAYSGNKILLSELRWYNKNAKCIKSIVRRPHQQFL